MHGTWFIEVAQHQLQSKFGILTIHLLNNEQFKYNLAGLVTAGE